MKRLFRILLAGIGVLALLAVAGVIYVTTFVDPNDLKPRLVEAVKEGTGLDLSLNGPISWTFYPRLGVTVEDAVARLPDQDRISEPFAAFERADVKIRFAPLMTGDVAVDGVALDGLRLNLVRGVEGRGNWQTLTEAMAQHADNRTSNHADKAAAEQDQQAKPHGVSNTAERPLSVDIANVQVTDGQVHYIDRRRDIDATLSHLTLNSSNVSLGSAFPLELAFDIDSISPALTSHVSLKGDTLLNLRDQQYAMENLTLDTATRLPKLGQDRTQTATLTGDRLSANVGTEQYRLEGGRLDAGLQLPALGDRTLPLKATFGASADLEEDSAQLQNLVITSNDALRLTGGLDIASLTAQPTYQGRLHLDPANLRNWLNQLDKTPDTADDQALTQIAFDTRLSGTAEKIGFNDLSLQMDDTTFTGSVSAGLDGRSLAFDLDGNALDLDRYLPPRNDSASDNRGDRHTAVLHMLGTTPALAATEGAALLPVDLLGQLALDGQLQLDSLKARGAKLSDVALKVVGHDGQHRLQQLSARLYDGHFKASGALDVRDTPMTLALDEKLDGVQLQPLLADVAQHDQLMRGTLALNGQFRSRTNRADTLVRNLNGQAAMTITDGALIGTNISRQLCTAAATVQGRETTREWGSDTPFDSLKASATITDGVVSNDDLDIAIPGIALSGKGQANLATQRFDYDLGAHFVDTADSQACRVTEALSQVRLPLHCEGSFSDQPDQWCRFDQDAFRKVLGDMAASKGKRELQDQLNDKLGKQIDDKLGEGTSKNLRDRLEGLFK